MAIISVAGLRRLGGKHAYCQLDTLVWPDEGLNGTPAKTLPNGQTILQRVYLVPSPEVQGSLGMLSSNEVISPK